MRETNEPLTEQADDLIAATILAGGTWQDAADAIGRSRATVGRRLEDPQLRRRIEHERASALYRIGNELADLSGLALGIYREVLTDPDATTSQRLRASDGVLSTLRTYSADIAMADRFADLEERLCTAEAIARGDLLDTTATETPR